MIPYTKVINGISKYIDDEILNKINGYQKWILGTGAGVILNKATDIFNSIKLNPLIKGMGLVNENDEIDIDSIYKELKKQAQKSAVTFDVPLVGTLTLNETDVDKLYNTIMEG